MPRATELHLRLALDRLAPDPGRGPDTARLAGGSRSHPRRAAAPLSRLWAAPPGRPAVAGGHPPVAPRASPLGGRADPRRTESAESGDRDPVGTDAPALAAPARPG